MLNDYPTTKEVLSVLERDFSKIEWADQGTLDMPDAYFWITEGEYKVEVDNFTSMEFQVKCKNGKLLLIKKVIDVLSKSFSIEVLTSPELEAHE